MPEPDKPQTWIKHAIYMFEIDFYKIKRICYQFDSEGRNEWLKMMIEMHAPANARKCLGKNVNYVRSPLNMHSQNYFLNNWNTNQCFFLQGRSSLPVLKIFLDVIKEQCPSVKISSSFIYSLLKKADMIETAKKLISRSHKFKVLME